MAILIPDRIKTVQVGLETLTINQRIIPDSARASKYVASHVLQGQPMKPCAKLNGGWGTPKGVTIHNTGDIPVAAGTTPAEQYTRATWPNCNMGGVVVHFYVWHDVIWQLLDESERGWHAADGQSRRSSQRKGETIGGNLDTIAIEAIGPDLATEATVAKLTAYLLQEHGLSADTDIYTHNYFYSAKYCPVYILPHWSRFMASVKAYSSTAPKALSVGDVVAFLGGSIYASSTADAAAGERESSSCKLTFISQDADHPYHIISVDGGGVYGWVDACAISEGIAPKAIAVGSAVKVIGDSYATGQNIPDWVKSITHNVAQIAGEQALLGFPNGICSWVRLADLKLVG